MFFNLNKNGESIPEGPYDAAIAERRHGNHSQSLALCSEI